MIQSYVFWASTVVTLWTVFWGYRYHSQMKSWRHRATVAEYMLKKVRDELKVDSGHVAIETEAQIDDVLVDAEHPEGPWVAR